MEYSNFEKFLFFEREQTSWIPAAAGMTVKAERIKEDERTTAGAKKTKTGERTEGAESTEKGDETKEAEETIIQIEKGMSFQS